MTRERLPDRRRQVTDNLFWPPAAPKRYHISAGFDPAGNVREAFIRGGSKVGSDRDVELDDLAVVLSRLLQHGDRLEDIRAGLSGRAPDGTPATFIAAVIDLLIDCGG